jgi:hypothetical protein
MEIFQTTAKMQQSQSVAPKQNVADVQSVQQIQKAQIHQDKVAQKLQSKKRQKLIPKSKWIN